MKPYCTAVVLAAGQGRRMGGTVRKQYMDLGGRPVLYYALQAFECSPLIDSVVLVAGDQEQISYCRRELLERYQLRKVELVTTGGRERYDSVFRALRCIREKGTREAREGYVLIHDGARPFVTEEILERCLEAVEKYEACAAGMPAKETVKIADAEGFAASTPDRDLVWTVQTPQAFSFALIEEAYERMLEKTGAGTGSPAEGRRLPVTDDAMVVETFTNKKVKLVEGSYRNIKITTPEDLKTAALFLREAF